MKYFIVFEGPDGSGTTKHSQLLVDRFRKEGKDVLLTAEPTEGMIGKEIRTILHGETLPSPEAVQLLFCADRADHVQTIIEPSLESGKIVVTDRYALSTYIYGSVFGVERKWLEEINSRFPKPDLTIITLPPYEVCRERIGNRASQDQFEREDFQRRVYDAYKTEEASNILFIDTSGPKEEVAEVVYTQVIDFFKNQKVHF